MNSFSFYYIEANIVCVIVFGLLLLHNHLNIDRQEKQLKFGMALIAFILYFLVDCVWALIIDGLIAESIHGVVTFMLYLFMTAIIYYWLQFVLAHEQVPRRTQPIFRFAVGFPFLISTVLLIVNFIVAPQTLINDSLETQPLFTAYLSVVPDLYMVAILFYTIRRARREENPIEKRKHVFIGAFPLLVSVGGLVQELLFPYAPIFCFTCLILMLVFYIQSLEYQVSLDPLTNLNNRGQLTRYTSQKSSLYLEGRKTVVAMLDIDRFKSINDTYGHAEGDNALIVVAEALKKAVNHHSMPSFLCRYGGDEFILILHPTQMREAEALIQDIRDEVARSNGNYPLSVSIGCDELMPAPDTIQSCMKRADKKLYLDKDYGRLHGRR